MNPNPQLPRYIERFFEEIDQFPRVIAIVARIFILDALDRSIAGTIPQDWETDNPPESVRDNTTVIETFQKLVKANVTDHFLLTSLARELSYIFEGIYNQSIEDGEPVPNYQIAHQKLAHFCNLESIIVLLKNEREMKEGTFIVEKVAENE